jgi:PAS domain S-box-containing protein
MHIKNTCSMIDEIIQKGKTIQESEERYRKMINSMPDAVLEIDSGGNILFCSGQVLNSLGYNPDALIGKNIFDLVDSDLREDIRTKFSDSVRQSYYFRNLVFPVKSSKGTDVIMELNGYTFFGENSLPSGFRMVSRDITERLRLQNEKRKMEKQLMQAQKMEALGTLAGGIAHDFNNVLAAIIGSLEILSFNIKNGNLGSDKELDKYIELAYDSAKKASEVIKQLLKISGKNHLSTERVNLNMTINSVTNLCKNSFPKSINISYNSAIENAIVCCDPLQLEQAILNICINAMHAMTIMRNDDEKRGGVIDITLSQMFDENNIKNITPYNVSGKYYKIDIRDTGVGIDKDKLEHIFEPFYTTKGEGTGLGLFMVYNTIKEMGGFITVDSVPGEGTCFSLYIPVLTE